MNIRDRFKIGDIVRLVVPFDPNQLKNKHTTQYIEINYQFYYRDKKAIIVGYDTDCKFSLDTRYRGAIALASNGDILRIHDDNSWRVTDHCDFTDALQDLLSKSE